MLKKNIKKIWTLEKLQEEALKYTSRVEFKTNNLSAYRCAKRRYCLDDICKYMKRLRNKPYTTEDLGNIAKNFLTRGEFQKKNSSAYGVALNKGILDQICVHMVSLLTSYSIEKIQEEALKFKTRKDFQVGSPAYRAAWRRGILDRVCSHMPKHVDRSGENNGNFKWTNEAVHAEALKFFSRSDFKFGSPKLYDVAIQRKLMDKICSHMKKSGNVSKPELELLNKIKEIYPSVTTYRKRDVKIENKPYIKGFYIDIFVSELNKGIEFDGDWHHSFDGLKRARESRGWSDEDIKNYHKYKDEYFKSKGIEVLHIKWTDWILNKKNCIDECLKFLFT